MLINTRLEFYRQSYPLSNCRKCHEIKICDCLCHEEDIIQNRHYEIHREPFDFKVQPVRDLDHFRHEGFRIWLSDLIYRFRVRFSHYDLD